MINLLVYFTGNVIILKTPLIKQSISRFANVSDCSNKGVWLLNEPFKTLTLTSFITRSRDWAMCRVAQPKVIRMWADCGHLNFVYKWTSKFPVEHNYVIKCFEKMRCGICGRALLAWNKLHLTSIYGSRLPTSLTMKAFSLHDEFVYFLITMRLCLAELIYVSI